MASKRGCLDETLEDEEEHVIRATTATPRPRRITQDLLFSRVDVDGVVVAGNRIAAEQLDMTTFSDPRLRNNRVSTRKDSNFIFRHN